MSEFGGSRSARFTWIVSLKAVQAVALFSIAGPPIGAVVFFLAAVSLSKGLRGNVGHLFFLMLIFSYVFGVVSAFVTGVVWANLRNMRRKATAAVLLPVAAVLSQSAFSFFLTDGKSLHLFQGLDLCAAAGSSILCALIAERHRILQRLRDWLAGSR